MELIFLTCIIFIVVVVSLISKNNLKNKDFRGNRGEREVNKILEKIANKVGGMEFLDILLDDGNYTTQIDNILLTRKALYVFEIKDYSGWIFGSQSNTYWTQVFTHYVAKTSGNNYTESGVSKYKFYNPIKQNGTHINMIIKLTKVNKLVPVYNIVVFGSNATLKDVKHNEEVFVIKTYQVENLINQIESNLCKELEPNEQARIVDAILYLNVEDKEKRIEHIRSIRSKYNI